MGNGMNTTSRHRTSNPNALSGLISMELNPFGNLKAIYLCLTKGFNLFST